MAEETTEKTITDRSGLIGYRLGQGERFTAQQVADICGYRDRRGAHQLMGRLSRTLPLVCVRGVWYAAELDAKGLEQFIE